MQVRRCWLPFPVHLVRTDYSTCCQVFQLKMHIWSAGSAIESGIIFTCNSGWRHSSVSVILHLRDKQTDKRTCLCFCVCLFVCLSFKWSLGTLIPASMVKGCHVLPTSQKISAANGTDIPLLGYATVLTLIRTLVFDRWTCPELRLIYG